MDTSEYLAERLHEELELPPDAAPDDVLNAVRRLKAGSRFLTATARTVPPAEDAPDIPAAPDGAPDPRVALARMRDFASRIATLNGTVASMESQLRALYADRERLEAEIGASEVGDVIAAFRHLQTVIGSMEQQLAAVYEGVALLEAEIGRSEPAEIVALFKKVTQLVSVAREELAAR